MISLPEDGLAAVWEGRVWLNPPYGNAQNPWLEKLAEHGNGIALIPASPETSERFFLFVWSRANAFSFIKGRIRFHLPDGTLPPYGINQACCLVAYGIGNIGALLTSRLGAVNTTIVPYHKEENGCSKCSTANRQYRATDNLPEGARWASPLFMRRRCSRIILEITDVRGGYDKWGLGGGISEDLSLSLWSMVARGQPSLVKAGVSGRKKTYAGRDGEDGMTCPSCGDRTIVIDSRPKITGTYRRRRCTVCGGRFSTIERNGMPRL